jgi:hypothetical protein
VNAAPNLPRTGFKFTLSVRSGPEAGAVYQLLPPRVSIGRDPSSNNVVINDPRVSRNAIVIDFAPEEISVTDVSGRARMTVNGVPGERLSIKGGDVISLGETEIVFIVEALQLPAVVQPGGVAPQALGGNLAGYHGTSQNSSTSSGSTRPTPRPQGRNKTFYIVVALIFGALIYIGSSEEGEKQLDRTLRTTSEIEKEISETDTRIQSVVKKRSFRTEEEKTRYEEAQKHYLTGFRDYQKGNFTRAMRSFETARAIDPEHPLALRYYRLAEKQRDETVTQLILEGRRYREKNMFSRCSAAIEKALVLMNNKDDLKYKQAAAMKKECDLLQEDRF